MRRCLSGTSASPSTRSNASLDAWASASRPSPRRQFTQSPLFNRVLLPQCWQDVRDSLRICESERSPEFFISTKCWQRRAQRRDDEFRHLRRPDFPRFAQLPHAAATDNVGANYKVVFSPRFPEFRALLKDRDMTRRRLHRLESRSTLRTIEDVPCFHIPREGDEGFARRPCSPSGDQKEVPAEENQTPCRVSRF